MRREKVRAKMRRNKRRKSVYVCVLKAKSDDMTTASHYNFVCPSSADRLNDVAINKTLITILDDWFLNATQSTKSHRFFSAVCIFCCFVSFFFFFMSEFDMHSQYYAMLSLMRTIGRIISVFCSRRPKWFIQFACCRLRGLETTISTIHMLNRCLNANRTR